MAIWDDLISDEEKKVYAKSGWGKATSRWGSKPAILVVDMTYGFVDDRFPLGYGKTGRPCAGAIAELLSVGRTCRIPIFYTSGLTIATPAQEGRWKFPLAPSFQDTDKNKIVSELEPHPIDAIIKKRRPSAFFGTELTSLLIYHSIDTVIVTGMVTGGCIRATVIDAFSYNYIVIVPEECVADRSAVSHKINLFDMHMKYADVSPLETVIAYLKESKIGIKDYVKNPDME